MQSYDEAQKQLLKAFNVHPTSAAGVMAWATVLSNLHEFEHAARMFELVLRLDRSSHLALVPLAVVDK